MGRRFLSLIMAVAMITTSLPAGAFPAYAQEDLMQEDSGDLTDAGIENDSSNDIAEDVLLADDADFSNIVDLPGDDVLPENEVLFGNDLAEDEDMADVEDLLEDEDLAWDEDLIEDLTFYAASTERVSVTWDANGGYFGDKSENWTTDTTFVSPGDFCGWHSYPVKDDPDILFLGWSLEADGEVAYNPRAYDDMTLYAQYAPACTITFVVPGGNFYDGEKNYGEEVVISKPLGGVVGTFDLWQKYHMNEPEEKKLLGWEVSDGTYEDSYNEWGEHPVSGDLVFTAVWGQRHYITWDPNGGYFDIYGNKEYIYTEATAENQPISRIVGWRETPVHDDGLVFSGWSETPDGKVPVDFWTRDANNELVHRYYGSEDHTFYAIWKDESEPDTEDYTEMETETEPETEIETESEPETENETESEPEAEIETESEPETENETEAETETENETEAETETEPGTEVEYTYACVHYEFESGSPGEELPQEVYALVPDDAQAIKGSSYTLTRPAVDIVDTADGYWMFEQYESESRVNADGTVLVNGDVRVIGRWMYSPEHHTVHFVFRPAIDSTTGSRRLPSEVTALTPQDLPVWKSHYVPLPWIQTKNVETTYGNWTFVGYDGSEYVDAQSEKVTVGKEDITLIGRWSYADEKHSLFTHFVSDTEGRELPAKVLALLPDTGTGTKGYKIAPADPIPGTAVKDGAGSWIFQGYEPKEQTMGKDNAFVTGHWKYVQEAYDVTYIFAAKDGSALPQEVMALLPAVQAYKAGETVTATAPETRAVDTASGIWYFEGYDKNTLTISGKEEQITGIWSYEEEYHEVRYDFRSAGTETLPQEILGLLPGSQNIRKGTDVTAALPACTEIGMTDGTWSFRKYDQEKITVGKEDVVFTGTWRFTKKAAAGEPDADEVIQAVTSEEPGDLDQLENLLPEERNVFRASVNVTVESNTPVSMQMDISVDILNQNDEVVEKDAQLAAPITISMTLPGIYQNKTFIVMHFPDGRENNGVQVTYSYSQDGTAIRFVVPTLCPIDIVGVQCRSQEDHIWDMEDPAETVDPTCEEDGYVLYHCGNDCVAMHKVIIPRLSHDWGEGWSVKTPATCTEDAEQERTCSFCHKTETRTAIGTKLGHSLTENTRQESTCTVEGHTQYWTCSVCGKLFSDPSGSREITLANTVIEPIGHQWGAVTYTWSADNTKVTAQRTCSHDGSHIQKEIVSVSLKVTQPATCKAKGKVVYTSATFKNAAFAVQTKSAADTTYASHTLVKTAAKAATVASEGNTEYYTCSVCGKIFSDAKAKKEIKKSDTVTSKLPNPEGDVNDKASVAAADKEITKMSDTAEPKGSSFAVIQVKSTKQTTTSITVSWNKIKGATGYIIYGNKCGKTTPFIRLSKQKKNSFIYKKLKKGTYYKFSVVAYKTVNGKDTIIASGKTIHVATKGGKVTNISKLKLNVKSKVTLKKGKKLTLKVTKVKQASKLKLAEHRKIKYESSNAKVATVSAKGKITAKKKGSCYIYVYAHNGVFSKVKITMK